MTSWKRQLADLGGASIASAAATLVDGAIYAALVWALVRDGSASIGLAAGIAALFGGVVHFLLNRFWVFGRFHASLKLSALTYFGVSWVGAAIHGVLTGLLVHAIGPPLGRTAGWLASKGLIWLVWTYPLTRYVVFGGLGARTSGKRET